jgi:hypothetical protein
MAARVLLVTLSDTERRLAMTVALRGRFTEGELVAAVRAFDKSGP